MSLITKWGAFRKWEMETIDALRMFFIIHIIHIVTYGINTDGVLPL